MLSKQKLETVKQLIKVRTLSPSEVEQLVNQAIEQQDTIERWYGLLSLISRSGSSWASKIREALDEYHFGTTEAETIDAVKTLLQKHQGSSVETVLQLLARMDAPISRSRPKS